MARSLKGFVDFGGPQWTAIKLYLEEAKESKIGLLIAPQDERKSDNLRGAIEFINQLLREEAAALRPQ